MSEKAMSPPRMLRPSSEIPSIERSPQRIDAGDRRHAECDAGDETRRNPKDHRGAPGAPAAGRRGRLALFMTRRRRPEAGELPASIWPGGDSHGAVAARRKLCIVRDEDERRPPFRDGLEDQVGDLPSGVVSRLPVGSSAMQDCRVDRERTGDRDALLLAAGKLRRIVCEPRAQADLAEHCLCARETHRCGRQAPSAPRHSRVPSSSASGGRPGTRSRSPGRGNAPAGLHRDSA